MGGLLYWADCLRGYTITDTFNALVHDGRTPGVSVLGQPIVPSLETGVKGDELGAGQISFYDQPRYQGESTSILNVKWWGEESDGSYAQAWDCSQGTTPIETTPPGATTPTHVTNVSQPTTSPSPSTTGSPAGTVNSTMSGVDQCDRRTQARGGTGGAYARYPYESAACFAHVCEADEVSGLTAGKVTTTGMVPIEAPRPGGAGSLVDPRTPPDYGVHMWPNTERYGFGDQDLWETYFVPLSNAGTFYHTTYYAYVSPAAVSAYNLKLPNTVTGTYGSAACGAFTSGVRNGWQCDPAKWWLDPNGVDVRPRDASPDNILGPCEPLCVDTSIRVGQPFNLRDIDCVDLTLAKEQRAQKLAPQQVADKVGDTAAPLVGEVAPGLQPTVQSLVGTPPGGRNC